MARASASHVTVVVPAYDREAVVEAAIRSVLDQDWPSLDVVAIDDGSRDRTLAVLRAIDDPRVTVLSNDGLKGASGARNAALAHARGDWIAFQDSDDLWRPGRLSRQMPHLVGSAHVGGFCAMDVTGDAFGTARKPEPALGAALADPAGVERTLLREPAISTQLMIVRADALRRLGGFDPAMPPLEDWDLALRLLRLGTLHHLPEALVEQRISPNSISQVVSDRRAAMARILERHRDRIIRVPGALRAHEARLA